MDEGEGGQVTHERAMLIEAITSAHRLLVALREVGWDDSLAPDREEVEALIPRLRQRLDAVMAA